jgi:hypothetical protein
MSRIAEDILTIVAKTTVSYNVVGHPVTQIGTILFVSEGVVPHKIVFCVNKPLRM